MAQACLLESLQCSSNPDTSNIDKVRDLLFGGQMRDYDRRFTRFEERLVQESTELKEDVRKRLLALEQFVKQETASLADRIKAENSDRVAAAKELGREVRDNAKATEKKTGQIDAQVEKLQGELRKQILDLHKRVTDDIRGKIDDVLATAKTEVVSQTGDSAKVKISYTMFEAPLSFESEMVKLDGRWYGKDSLESLKKDLAEPAVEAEPAVAGDAEAPAQG